VSTSEFAHVRHEASQEAVPGLIGESVAENAIALVEGRRFSFARLNADQLETAHRALQLDDVYRLTAFGPHAQLRWIRRQDRSGIGDLAWLGPVGPTTTPSWGRGETVEVDHMVRRRGLVWGRARSITREGWTEFHERQVGMLQVPVSAAPGQFACIEWDTLYIADPACGLLRCVGYLYRDLRAVHAHDVTSTPDRLQRDIGG
jgi:CRISPR-associated protein (TIGR03984 family)